MAVIVTSFDDDVSLSVTCFDDGVYFNLEPVN
jgi:hypothetical protein